MYGIRFELPVLHRAEERSAVEIALRSRRTARVEELRRWAAEEERRAGREPRSSHFRVRCQARARHAWGRGSYHSWCDRSACPERPHRIANYPRKGRFCRRGLRSAPKPRSP